MLKQTFNSWGYLCVKLCIGEHQKTVRVHRLVAEAFVRNEYKLPCVNHKDENKLNNKAENLEWCTWRYNAIYGHRLDSVRGEKWSKYKLSKSEVLDIRSSYIPYDQEFGATALSKKYGVSLSTIKSILQRKTWKKI